MRNIQTNKDSLIPYTSLDKMDLSNTWIENKETFFDLEQNESKEKESNNLLG